MSLTVGELINKLQKYHKDTPLKLDKEIVLTGYFDSYRGHYDDAALEYIRESRVAEDSVRTVGEVLRMLWDIDGSIVGGYKGGEYYLGLNTVCWIANYGETKGWSILDVKLEEGEVFLVTEKIKWLDSY